MSSYVPQELLDNVESLCSIDRPAGGANSLGAGKRPHTRHSETCLWLKVCCVHASLQGVDCWTRVRIGSSARSCRSERVCTERMQGFYDRSRRCGTTGWMWIRALWISAAAAEAFVHRGLCMNIWKVSLGPGRGRQERSLSCCRQRT